MKKVGILTTYFAYNFGAMLQPFALKRTLESLGCDVEMIRYKQESVYNYYSPFCLKRLFSLNPITTIKYVIHSLFNYGVLKKRETNFKQFMLRHITSTDSFVKNVPADKDIYFIGSDQLWNPYNLGGFDEVYMGNFNTKENAIKATYAISAGSLEFNTANVSYLKEHIKNFDYISVREDSLKGDLSKYLGFNDSVTVLDPTLLADPQIYEEVKITNPLPEEDYIMLYYIRDCSAYLNKLCNYAKDKRMKLLILSEGVKNDVASLAKMNDFIKYMPEVGEDIFLGGIKNAQCVFTPSFHGVVFSIIYHRPFYSLQLTDNNNKRTQDLLNMVGLTNRILNLSDEIKIDQQLDFKECDNNIVIERRKSLHFINNVLNSYCPTKMK